MVGYKEIEFWYARSWVEEVPRLEWVRGKEKWSLHEFKISKDKLKRCHDQIVFRKKFQKRQKVLLYDSKLHIFFRKLKSWWNGPYLVHKAYSNGVVEIANPKIGISPKLMDIDLNHIWNLWCKRKSSYTSLNLP